MGANESSSDKGDITPGSEVGTSGNIENTNATEPEQWQSTGGSKVQDDHPASPIIADEGLRVGDFSPAIVSGPDPFVPASTPQSPIEVLTQGVVEISIDDRTTIRHRRPPLHPFATVSNYDSDSEPDLPPSPICSLHDEDFPWDSEM